MRDVLVEQRRRLFGPCLVRAGVHVQRERQSEEGVQDVADPQAHVRSVRILDETLIGQGAHFCIT
jgi:hypothetical protein